MDWIKFIGKIGIGLGSVFGAGCDSGDIYPEQNNLANTRTIEVTCLLEHVETIPTARERKLLWAAFESKDNLQQLYSERITAADAGKEQKILLAEVPEDAAYVAMVLTDQTSNVLHIFWGQDIIPGKTDLTIDAGAVDLVSFERIQHQLFDQSCLQCHQVGNASAGLVLEENSSYAAIVGRPSKTDEGKKIVQSGSLEQSEMYLRLTDTDDFHSKFSTLKDDDVNLLSVWIRTGALK